MILALGFIIAACTSEGIPSSFEDQNNRIERQFVAACVEAQDGADDAQSYCECAFYTAAAELGFEDFLALDETLQENPDGLTFEQRELFENISLPCELSAADIS